MFFMLMTPIRSPTPSGATKREYLNMRAPTRRATDLALGYMNEPKPVIRRCGYYQASTRSVIATPATGSRKACSMLGTSSRRSANRLVRA